MSDILKPVLFIVSNNICLLIRIKSLLLSSVTLHVYIFASVLLQWFLIIRNNIFWVLLMNKQFLFIV